MFRLAILFLVVPLVEFALLVQVGKAVGVWPTILLVVVTGAVGGVLARQQGITTWQRFKSRLADGALPGNELVDGVIILLAGALLVTPGILTDIVGLCGLIPFTRRPLQRLILERARASMVNGNVRVFNQGAPSEKEGPGTGDHNWGGSARSRPRHAAPRDDKIGL